MKKFGKGPYRRILSLVLAMVLVCVSLPLAASAATEAPGFYDVQPTDWYAGWVYALNNKGIINGTDAHHYKPTANIDRASFVKLLATAAATDNELEGYKNMNLFSDVPSSAWSAKYVNWGSKNGIVNGTTVPVLDEEGNILEPGKFSPSKNITCEEAATMLYRFAKAFPDLTNLDPVSNPVGPFADADKISNWALEATEALRLAGVFTGDGKGHLNPLSKLSRGQAATIIGRILRNIEQVPESQIPVPPAPPKPAVPAVTAPTTGSKSGATYVEINPAGYTPRVSLANSKLYSTTSYSSFVNTSKDVVAVDGIAFDSYGGATANEVWGTIVSQGEVVRIYNNYISGTTTSQKPTLMIDKNGKATIEYPTVSLTLTRGDSTLDNVGCNIKVNDSTRMVYTSKFGKTVSGTFALGIAVDKSNKVSAVYKNVTNPAIPEGGYLVLQRSVRKWGDEFFTDAKKGDSVTRTVKYNDKVRSDIVTVMSNGPTLLKNGVVFTNYASEGFTDAHYLASSAHMAIGVKSNGNLVIASYSGSLSQLGKIMKDLGCTNAFNLDGGASTALFCNGKWLATPGRQLTNMLVFRKPE